MRGPWTQLHVHLCWATWDRKPLITPALEGPLYAAFTAKCVDLDVVPVAIGGTVDHVHLLLRLTPVAAVADVVKHLKGSSSHFMAHRIQPGRLFKWQGAYGAFTVSPSGVPVVRNYILRQKEHHAANTTHRTMELTQDPVEP